LDDEKGDNRAVDADAVAPRYALDKSRGQLKHIYRNDDRSTAGKSAHAKRKITSPMP
jgi:hypothetical protein